MTTSNYPRRRAVARQRPWQPEVPAAFTVPDVPEAAELVPPPAAAAAPEVAATAGVETANGTVAGRSRDGSVEVEVDLHGHLRSLRIDPSALRGPHPQRVGAAVVEAMSVACTLANRLYNERRRR